MTVLELPASPPPPSHSVPPRRWKWTGADLLRMGEAGLLPPEGRFELLDGEIYQLMPPGTLHTVIVNWLQRLLHDVCAAGAFIQVQSPIQLNDEYEPQPDVAIVRGTEWDFEHRFPGPADLLLVIEVADSSLEHDRNRKLPVYAAAGIPEYWLVNLPEQCLEVYLAPDGETYRTRHLYRSGDTVAPLAFPDLGLTVAHLLNRPSGETSP